ncbi:MAG: 50S ribosomal protein L9 [Acidiferrobacterales bacterium]|nr:50S ribosomal protein L9 [Acidiferrobacterales bacterium]
MEIILLEKIQNVGDLGELVNVKNGYARNYLIPQKKAVRATEDAKSLVEEKRRQLAEEESKRVEAAKARAELAVKEISVSRLCSEEGKLYGSVTPADIAETMTEAGTRIEKSEVFLPEGPLKHTGDFEADVILHPEVRFSIKVNVAGEESEAPEGYVDDTPAEPVPAPAEEDAAATEED